MTLAVNQLFSEADGPSPGLRVHVSEHGVKVATLLGDDALDPAQITLPKLTPLVWDGTGYRHWLDEDERVHALLAEEVTLDLNDEVQGNILIRAQVSRLDIPTPAGETADTLTAALKKGCRELGLDITDLSGADLPAVDHT